MARKSVIEFDPAKGIPSEPIYTDDDIARIVGDHDLSIERRAELANDLENVAQAWLFEAEWVKRPTFLQKAEAFDRIHVAAARLLDALHVGESGNIDEMPTALRFGGLQAAAAMEAAKHGGEATGESLLRGSLSGIANIAKWSGAMRDHARNVIAIKAEQDRLRAEGIGFCFLDERDESLKSSRAQSPNSGDIALDKLFGDLMGIWLDYWNRPIGTASTNSQEAGGPMVVFIESCLAPLMRIPPTRAGIRDRVRRLTGHK